MTMTGIDTHKLQLLATQLWNRGLPAEARLVTDTINYVEELQTRVVDAELKNEKLSQDFWSK